MLAPHILYYINDDNSNNDSTNTSHSNDSTALMNIYD